MRLTNTVGNDKLIDGRHCWGVQGSVGLAALIAFWISAAASK